MSHGKTSSAENSGPPVESVRVSAVSNSSPVTRPNGERNSTIEVLLQVQLWTAETTERAALPAIVVAMVADLLSSSACEIRDNPSASFAAVFRGAAAAINSTRQIHRLLQEFSKAGGAVRLGGCFILSSPEEGKLAELDVRGHLHTVAAEHSGQILLVGGFCKAAQLLPGLRLEPLDQAAGGQPSIFLLLPPAQWKGNTASLPELWAPLPAAEEAPVTSNVVPEPMLDTTIWNVNSRPLSVVETQDVVRLPLRRGVDDAPTPADPVRRRRLLTWVGGAVLGAAAVGGVVLFTGGPKTRPTPPQPPGRIPPNPIPVNGPPPTKPQPSGTDQGPVLRPKLVPGNGPTLPPPRRNPPPPGGGQEPARGRSPDGVDKGKGVIQFSPQDVDQVIANADKDAGDGRYEKAINEYKIALRYQSKNERALQGLARALRNQGQE